MPPTYTTTATNIPYYSQTPQELMGHILHLQTQLATLTMKHLELEKVVEMLVKDRLGLDAED